MSRMRSKQIIGPCDSCKRITELKEWNNHLYCEACIEKFSRGFVRKYIYDQTKKKLIIVD
ncbi:MAG: hypothetical protein J7K98_00510 [Candidatus Aenigmarchaeota archaeon]|nr:hypothetical protein [Candidatus Aenigmarchaeota archaeon]